MKTKTTVMAVFGAVAIAIGVTTLVLINRPIKAPVQQVAASETVTKTQANLVSFTAEKGKNVLEQLKSHATVVTKDSQYGPYVETINGIKGGTDGKYWSFYVNGSLAQKGAADYITEGGEKIEWKFE
jgi:hypothetical protein